MNGITTSGKGMDISLFQRSMPAFNVIEHPQEGIYILLEGEMTWQDSTNTYDISHNELLFVRRGSYAAKTRSDTCKLLWLPLSTTFLHGFLQRFGTLLSEVERHNMPTPELIAFTSSPLLSQSINGLVDLLAHDYPAALGQLRTEELLLLMAFGEQGSLLMSVLRQLSNRQVERLQSFMENHYLKEWKLSEFAKEFGMGLTTFKELFRSVYGISPRAWISERRILYAHQLLLNSEMSIVDISMEAGFSSQSYFTQSYRRRFNCTPSRARYGKE
ncbi:helix-turn-helix transcriptional regulator [Photorhabdus caribbeanensis]|uniref:helix-turn-helix transcriptional regulator n=1 Tax=Photorhabdus caribbeanensis TaxID=1004165 RepID=UPI001BD29454|nr:AraC family transcriptional regulator [Photorhabdus caribbeanensis]MBS9422201.1 AraC family transcriptional regulator [Photorhabdus caribbeanensis]